MRHKKGPSWLRQILLPAVLLAVATLGVSTAALRAADTPLPWPNANQIVSEIAPPTFPDQVFDVLDYGAVGNGTANDTQAIQNAIDDCYDAGGGTVELPSGHTYSSGALELLSDVNLQIDTGATLKFSSNAALFPLVHTRFQGIDLMNFSPLIYANGQSNIAVTGGGTLDASLTTWNLDGGGNFQALENQATSGVPIANRIYGSARPLRTPVILPFNCSDVLIQGITIQKSRFWQIHLCLCANVTVDSVTTNSTSGQTDGIDIEACTGVLVKDCNLTSGDDCVVIKAGRNIDPLRVHKPSQYIVVRDCTCAGPQGMLACGSEETDGVQHVYAYNLNTGSTTCKYGFFVKSNTLRGGRVEDINMDTISGKFTSAIFYATLTYNGETGTHLPSVKDLHFSNFTDFSAPRVVNMSGLSNDIITNVTLSDSTFSAITNATNTANFVNITYTNVTINGNAVNAILKPVNRR